jgi:hypothetical protein
MKTFTLFFRMNITDPEAQPTPEQMQAYMTSWTAWLEDIQGQGQLAPGGHHLNPGGIVLRKGGVREEGPYTAAKESVAGYILILAKNMDDALRLAQACPILDGEGTSVEVREVAG